MSPFLKMLKSQNPDKEYPSNTGQKWSNEEETLLLEELSENNDIQQIAQSHNRTVGGINARRRQIAYKLYINNTSMEEIILKTKLDKDQILKTINRQKNNSKQCKSVTEIKKPFLIESEIYEIKNDIKKLENIIKELVEIMKSVYEFEHA